MNVRVLSNRHLAWLAACALLLQALVPFFAQYQPSHTPSAKNFSTLYGDKVVICTGDGFQLVKWADIASGKFHPKPHHQYQCALCYVAAHGTAIAPAPILAYLPLLATVEALLSGRQTAVLPKHDWRPSLPRSPPARA